MLKYLIKVKQDGIGWILPAFLERSRLSRLIPDEIYLKSKFKTRLGYELDLDDPKTFNEKLQWLKVHDRRKIYTNMSDKFLVRDYIDKKVGKQYLIPLLGVWNNFNEIDFSKLPNEFALKTNHDSGGVVICKDKFSFNMNEARDKLTRSLKNNYYWQGREWQYKNIKPRIIAEEYLSGQAKIGLVDYKLMCFNGKVRCSFLCLNRNSKEGLNVDFYDLSWNKMPFERHYPDSGTLVNPPPFYLEMIKVAETIARGLPFVRVDFFIYKDKLYIGELTLHPGNGMEGFTPPKFDRVLGDWLKLPMLKRKISRQ